MSEAMRAYFCERCHMPKIGSAIATEHEGVAIYWECEDCGMKNEIKRDGDG